MPGLLILVSWSVCTGVLCKVYGHITHLFCLYSYSVFGFLMVSCFNEVNGFLEFISVILQTGSVPSSGICVYITVVSLDGLILSSIDKPFVSDLTALLFLAIYWSASFWTIHLGYIACAFVSLPILLHFFLGETPCFFLWLCASKLWCFGEVEFCSERCCLPGHGVLFICF